MNNEDMMYEHNNNHNFMLEQTLHCQPLARGYVYCGASPALVLRLGDVLCLCMHGSMIPAKYADRF